MNFVSSDQLEQARAARDQARRDRLISDAAAGLHATGTTVIELTALTGKLRADMRRAERCLTNRVLVMERTLARTERKVTWLFIAIAAGAVSVGLGLAHLLIQT